MLRHGRLNMDKKIILALIGIIAAVLGGGSFITYSNIVTTTITGDTITDITTNLNIDIDDIRELCKSPDVPKKYQAACELLEGLP